MRSLQSTGLDRSPVTITLSNGTKRTCKRTFDVVLGCTVVEVRAQDVDADPAHTLAGVRSFGTFGGVFYVVTDQAWLRHVDQDGNPPAFTKP